MIIFLKLVKENFLCGGGGGGMVTLSNLKRDAKLKMLTCSSKVVATINSIRRV